MINNSLKNNQAQINYICLTYDTWIFSLVDVEILQMKVRKMNKTTEKQHV